jgi:hypothetical protein
MSVDEFSWFTINILIPIFLPLLGVVPFKMLPMPAGIEVRLIGLVKDGQWCWTAICIGTASLYEVWQTYSQNLILPQYANGYIFLITVLLIFAIGLASGGAVFKTQILNKCASIRARLSNYQTLISSFFVVKLMSFFSSLLHFSITTLNTSQL